MNLIGCNVIRCEQGSAEWHMARAGCCTASMFSEVRKRPASGKNKGGFSATAQDYAFRLACERLSGKLLGGAGDAETWAQRRGHELEPAARAWHEVVAGVIVERAGFVVTEDGKFGASADGFIEDERAGTEYKCLVDPERMRTVLIDEDTTEFQDQMQGGMWITGLDRWHYGMYAPDLECIGGPLWWRVVKRDDDYIAALEQDLMRFDQLVEANVEKLRRVKWAA